MILGPMPTTGFSLHFDSMRNANVQSVAFATWLPDTFDLDFIVIPMSDMMGAPLDNLLDPGTLRVGVRAARS
jgi:hypothetical protein